MPHHSAAAAAGYQPVRNSRGGDKRARTVARLRLREERMDKHIIFFVAGVGDDVKGWSKGLRAEFKALFDSYPLPAGGMPFDQQFRTEEIFYNDFFDGWRKRAADDAKAALGLFGSEGLPSDAIRRLLEWGKSAGGGGFWRTHALDALQYRYLRLASEPVRAAVEFQIMTQLSESEFGTPARWSIISHSLGTSIVHDTLHEMFAPGAGAKDSEKFQPYAVVMLSNVSQLLHNPRVLGGGVDAYGSVVRPNREPNLGACRYYLHGNNAYDPIALAGRFNPPDDWLTDAVKVQRRLRNLPIEMIPKSRNVHGFSEYLAHPGVHVPLFRILTGDQDWITDGDEKKAHAAYEAANPLPSVNDAKRLLIEKLVQRAKTADLVEYVAILKEILDLLDE
jgi:hypothetical protein